MTPTTPKPSLTVERVTKNFVSHFTQIGYYIVTANNGLITQQAELQKRFKRMLSTPALGGTSPFYGAFSLGFCNE